MANYIFLSGIAEWAQLKSPNKFGNYQINLYVDKATRKQIKELGIRANPKDGNEEYLDGLYVTFRRPSQRKWRGETHKLEAPEVVDAEGEPFDGLIGNGSEVTVKVELYKYDGGVDPNGQPYDGGTGSRLVKVRVDNLVPYEAPEREDAPQAQPAMGVPF